MFGRGAVVKGQAIIFSLRRTASARFRGRSANVLMSGFASMLAKIVGTVVMIVTVPLAAVHLSSEGFGIWMTLTSLLLLVQFADFGIGNGLVTVLSSHHGVDSDDVLRTAVWTSLAILSAVCALLFVCFAIAWNLLDWQSVFGVRHTSEWEVSSAVAVFGILTCVAIPASIGQKALWGFQQASVAGLWQTAGNIAAIPLMLGAVYGDIGLAGLVAATVSGQFLGLLGATIDLLCYRHTWLTRGGIVFDLSMASRLLKLGGIWALNQGSVFVATALDAIFVPWLFGVEAMGMYGVMMRIVSGLSIAWLITMPLWPVFANAMAHNDGVWVRKTLIRALALCSVVGLGAAALVFWGAQPFARAWIGTDMVPAPDLVYAFAAWAFVYSLLCGVSALLGSEAFIRPFVAILVAGALGALCLKAPLAHLWGPAGVCWASVIGFSGACVAGMWLVFVRIWKRYAWT